jgi:hypothetical protein
MVAVRKRSRRFAHRQSRQPAGMQKRRGGDNKFIAVFPTPANTDPTKCVLYRMRRILARMRFRGLAGAANVPALRVDDPFCNRNAPSSPPFACDRVPETPKKSAKRLS